MPEDAPPKDSGASGTLGRKVGPFTIGAWLAIGAAGLGLGLLIRRSSLFSGGAAPADLPTETPPDTYDPGLPGYQAVGGTAGQNNQPIVTGPSSTRPTTNSDWLRVAVEGLSGSDNIAPQKSQPALQKFLEGTAVTQQEADIVSLAIRRYGAPPEGAPALRLIGAGGPDDYRDLTTAQVLALGRASYAAGQDGDGKWPTIAEDVHRRIMTGDGVNVLNNREPFDIYVLTRVIERHPELVPPASAPTTNGAVPRRT